MDKVKSYASVKHSTMLATAINSPHKTSCPIDLSGGVGRREVPVYSWHVE